MLLIASQGNVRVQTFSDWIALIRVKVSSELQKVCEHNKKSVKWLVGAFCVPTSYFKECKCLAFSLFDLSISLEAVGYLFLVEMFQLKIAKWQTKKMLSIAGKIQKRIWGTYAGHISGEISIKHSHPREVYLSSLKLKVKLNVKLKCFRQYSSIESFEAGFLLQQWTEALQHKTPKSLQLRSHFNLFLCI